LVARSGQTGEYHRAIRVLLILSDAPVAFFFEGLGHRKVG